MPTRAGCHTGAHDEPVAAGQHGSTDGHVDQVAELIHVLWERGRAEREGVARLFFFVERNRTHYFVW